ncbi:hypothetical protein LVY72_19120 [Arthrobacter sp. I2-34]|uniref:DUF8094 domain-containing protein n=1 Tax=Arthrobacter hankyongi TaxID=2904801 RepID=A0ABS9LBD9_9MICC|nr:hypothetical protein [Arthrobacter hankyongi]MCG2624008.1 hypothetical protein [Arthrobacter hankyongi]
MRLKIAVGLIVAGLLAVVWGIGLKTIWAPPETVTASYSSDAAAPLTVIEPAVLKQSPDNVDIKVEGDGEFLLAVGRSDDVKAWVGSAAHTTISGADDGALQGSRTDGDAKVPNPAGSDLWVSEETADSAIDYSWTDPAPGQWSILLAADGTKPAPTKVTVSWPNDTATPWALALIIVGALAAVLGGALAVVAGKRSVPPAPPAAGRPGGGRRVATEPSSPVGGWTPDRESGRARFAAGALAALALAAGPALPAQAAVPAAEAAGAGTEQAAAHPVLLPGQLTRIMDAVGAAVSAGDSAKDAKKLQDRVTGPALTMRSANYRVRAGKGKVEAPVPVSAGPVLTSMISSTPEWPRTAVAVTKGKNNPVPQVIVLSQAEARENYKMIGAVQMLPGTKFPQVSTEEGGTAAVAPADKDGLAYSPQQALELLSGYLTSGRNSNAVAKNTFADQIRSFQKDQQTSNKNAKITFSRSIDKGSVRTLRTADGGAVVYGTLRSLMRSLPSESGAVVELSPEFAALAGADSTTKGADVTYAEAVFLQVPPAGSNDKVSVVGVAQDLVAAKLK